MANLGRLHLAMSTSHLDIPGTDCRSLESLSCHLPLMGLQNNLGDSVPEFYYCMR